MSELFVLQNQDKLFLGKQNNWVDGRDLNALFKTGHRDEAINQMFEASSKDYRQRIKVIACAVNEKGLPVIDPSILPEPLPKPVKDPFNETTNSNERDPANADVNTLTELPVQP